MANEEHLQFLKQGVKAWNRWRQENRDVQPDLKGGDFRSANFEGADLSQADLSEARFFGANLSGANLSRAVFWGAGLQAMDLRGANLNGANFSLARFRNPQISEADFSESIMLSTIFANVDFSQAKGLETVVHHGPSEISISTIYRSRGKIPEAFLQGSGIPENFIRYIHSLVGSTFDFYSCFISHSSKDQDFTKCLHSDLQGRGVRCWYAPEDLRIGDKLRPSFDEAIRMHDKLMVVLSESSVKSTWVEKEVETAFEKEHQQNRMVLFPIRLDDAVMETQQAWAADIRRTRHIGDFREWKSHDSYKKAFERLLRDLKSEATAGSAAQE